MRQVRSRLDIALGRRLVVGQTWRCQCCHTEWRVRQVHRADCTAELHRPGERREIKFEELRKGWEQVDIPQQAQVAA